MKAIQFTIDEDLLRRMDTDPEVRAKGRSAFLRRAIAEYLQRKRKGAIREAYRRGYGSDPPAEGELDVAPERMVWPDE